MRQPLARVWEDSSPTRTYASKTGQSNERGAPLGWTRCWAVL